MGGMTENERLTYRNEDREEGGIMKEVNVKKKNYERKLVCEYVCVCVCVCVRRM